MVLFSQQLGQMHTAMLFAERHMMKTEISILSNTESTAIVLIQLKYIFSVCVCVFEVH